MFTWLYTAAGVGLLIVLALDVFQTVFHAKGRGGPLSRWQTRSIWLLVRWAGTVGRRRRDGVLALAGPFMAISTIGVWTLLLISGFALIHLPHVHDYHFSPGQPGGALLEAFYYSGIVTTTLGHGDVVAAGGLLRLVTVVQALAGFALVTVSVTYVLGIYRELIAAQGLATAVEARLKDPGDAPGGAPIDDHDAQWSITLQLAHVLESHYNFPILHYFRASRSPRALPVQVARLLAAARGTDDRSDDRSSSHRALRTLIGRYIGEVHGLFVRQEADADDDAERELARLRQILDMLAYDDPTAEAFSR